MIMHISKDMKNCSESILNRERIEDRIELNDRRIIKSISL